MAKEPPPPSTSLSLPPSQFAKLSPHSFLAAHLPNTRPSLRSPSTARAPTLHTGSLSHAHGSAVVRVGDTAVVCGIRGEILSARDANAAAVLGTQDQSEGKKDADTIAELGLLVPNIELATGCSPMHMPGNPPSVMAQSLTQRVGTLLRIADLVGLGELEIWDEGDVGGGATRSEEGNGDEDMDEEEAGEDEERQKPAVKAYWTLYIDILVISLDGSPFDAAWGAVLAALGDTQLPKAWWDRDRGAVVCDPRIEQAKRVAARGCPVALSFAAFSPPAGVGSKRFKDEVYVLADPDDFEEGCCMQTVTAVVDDGGAKVLRLEMGGGGMLDVADLKAIVRRTGERWKEWKGALDVARRV